MRLCSLSARLGAGVHSAYHGHSCDECVWQAESIRRTSTQGVSDGVEVRQTGHLLTSAGVVALTLLRLKAMFSRSMHPRSVEFALCMLNSRGAFADQWRPYF
jgi:hypothetical protein